MSAHKARLRILIGVLLVALLCVSLGAGLVFANPGGDNVSNAFTVPTLPFSTTGSLSATDPIDVRDVYAITLGRGQTLDASMTADAGTDFDLLLYRPHTASIDETADVPFPAMWSAGPTSVEHFTFMAADPGVYYLDVHAYKGAGSYTLDAKIIGAINFKIGGMKLSATSKKKGKAVTASATLTPAYNGIYTPVEFLFYRYENKRYKLKAEKWGAGRRNPDLPSTTLTYSYKFPKAGKWRVRAGFWDEAHLKETYTGYKYIAIK